ncbi:hypothetical protein BH10CYA1_BH10CYA1_55660 [soil metagenome]
MHDSFYHDRVNFGTQDYDSDAELLVRLIKAGGLPQLESYVRSFCDRVDEFLKVVLIAGEKLDDCDVEILPCVPQCAQYEMSNQVKTIVILSISLTTPGSTKILSICTSEDWSTRVLEAPHNSGLLSFNPTNADPVVLMRQIGSRASAYFTMPPPLFRT